MTIPILITIDDDLEIVFDSKMLMSHNVEGIIAKAYKNLGFVLRVSRPSRPINKTNKYISPDTYHTAPSSPKLSKACTMGTRQRIYILR